MNTVVFGLAKTGTSALFYKLKHSLPPHTISLFEPASRGPIPRLRVWLKSAVAGGGRRPLLAKVLPFNPKRPVRVVDFDSFDKQILLVRDPRDRLVSYLLYRIYNSTFWMSDAAVDELLDLLRAKEAKPDSVSLRSLITTVARLNGEPHEWNAWADAYREHSVCRPLAFHDERPNIHLFRYEDIVDRRYEQLERYMGMALAGSSEVGTEVRRVTRTKRYGDWKNWFTAEDIDCVAPLVAPYLSRYYASTDWQRNLTPHLDPRYGSGYVAMLVGERRAEQGARRT